LLVGTAIVLLLGRRVGRSDPLAWFLLAAALPALLFSLVYNPDLGAAHDWDLLSPPFFLVTVCAAYLLLARARPARLRLSAAIPWLAVSLLHTTAWLVANRLGL
jgi:predicted permease